jgi:hypothetical protein
MIFLKREGSLDTWGFGNDFRKVENIKFAVAQDLAGGAVEDKNMIVDRLQKLHRLVVERRVAAQKQGIEFGDGFKNQMFLFGATDDRLPVFRHAEA